MFKQFFKKTLKELDLFKHRKFFFFFMFIFEFYFFEYFEHFGLCGLRFELKGKISRKGNARKLKMFKKLNKNSTVNYSYKVNHLFFPVKTKTGALGCRIWFYYY